jgi:hypothetical protein
MFGKFRTRMKALDGFQEHVKPILFAYAENPELLNIQSNLYLGAIGPGKYKLTVDQQMTILKAMNRDVFHAYTGVTMNVLKRLGTMGSLGSISLSGGLLVKAFAYGGVQMQSETQEMLWQPLSRYFAGSSDWKHLARI